MKNNIIFEDINISPLLKAQQKFELFRNHLNSEQEKAGAIQAFEFCFELSWRTLKRVLNKKGLDVASPRDTFRTAAQNHLITSLEQWFDFQLKRNLTSHTYNDSIMEEVIDVLPAFSIALKQLTETLQHGEEHL
jgi:nucleotidyltransferase substrate binding protein (TIGR01987 family)